MPVKFLNDKVAVRKWVEKFFLHCIWLSHNKTLRFHWMRAQSSSHLGSKCMNLHLKIGSHCIRVMFRTIKDLAIHALSCSLFFDQYIKWTFSAEGRLVTLHPRPVAMLNLARYLHNSAITGSALAHIYTTLDIENSLKIEAKHTVLQQGTHAPLRVHGRHSGLSIKVSTLLRATCALLTATRGVAAATFVNHFIYWWEMYPGKRFMYKNISQWLGQRTSRTTLPPLI